MTKEAKKQDTAMEKHEKEVEFLPLGASDKIRLSASIIREFVAVPTKSGALPSERDCIRFMLLCRGKRANPFEGDCFMIGYDTQTGPQFSMVCGIELFLKRAEQHPSYDGYHGGIIVRREKEIMELQGSFMAPGDELLGGWARVFRKDIAQPIYKSVDLATYNTGQSRWVKDRAGMIAKIPLSQALRAAFPTPLGGMYTQEEMGNTALDGREPIAMPRATTTVEALPPPASNAAPDDNAENAALRDYGDSARETTEDKPEWDLSSFDGCTRYVLAPENAERVARAAATLKVDPQHLLQQRTGKDQKHLRELAFCAMYQKEEAQ